MNARRGEERPSLNCGADFNSAVLRAYYCDATVAHGAGPGRKRGREKAKVMQERFQSWKQLRNAVVPLIMEECVEHAKGWLQEWSESQSEKRDDPVPVRFDRRHRADGSFRFTVLDNTKLACQTSSLVILQYRSKGDWTVIGLVSSKTSHSSHDIYLDVKMNSEQLGQTVRGTKFWIHVGPSLISYERMYSAQVKPEKLVLEPSLLRGHKLPQHAGPPLSNLVRARLERLKLNPTQRRAVDQVLAAQNPSLHIWQGPPGTGKTFLITSLLTLISNKRVLAVAPSNQGVRVMLEGFMRRCLDHDSTKRQPWIAFIAVEENANDKYDSFNASRVLSLVIKKLEKAIADSDMEEGMLSLETVKQRMPRLWSLLGLGVKWTQLKNAVTYAKATVKRQAAVHSSTTTTTASSENNDQVVAVIDSDDENTQPDLSADQAGGARWEEKEPCILIEGDNNAVPPSDKACKDDEVVSVISVSSDSSSCSSTSSSSSSSSGSGSSFSDAEIDGKQTKQMSFASSLLRQCHQLLVNLNKEQCLDAQIEFIRSAHVVFCTCAVAGRKFVLQALGKAPVNFLVIDEACQSVEPETWIPLQCYPTHVLLVGDHKQLGATVKSNSARAGGFQRSLMQRLIECNYPYTTLDVQYRMHPEIARFSNTKYYDGAIKDDDSVAKRTKVCEFEPWSFFDVKNGIEQRRNSSIANPLEAQKIASIVAALAKSQQIKLATDVIIITFYAAQVQEIQKALAAGYPNGTNVALPKVATVDSFQGAEAPIVILSFVRANAQHRIGFLRDERRLNVALTRARRCLLAVGNLATLASCESKDLCDLMQAFKERNLVHSSC